ncbi:hypothetical protein [Streptomonospora wellingtoniae]|uniref:Uncharacterized protein n=1 Tax=Streptomonospora wellingtoniae TaxID=3075544 RepID=A0ABU2KYN3_9ACTN|nr:hypothetical protein [Streptomonospora sp. DSM 45055]MDT0304183.1 hypothetical protein [Streptomonospora sp. DSM 45055]
MSAPSAPARRSRPPAPAPRRRLPAVLAAAALCLPLGAAVGAGGLPLVDSDLFTAEVQRVSSAGDGVRYDPDTAGSGSGPLPIVAVLLRHPGIGGGGYTLRLGHRPDSYFHEVPVPEGTGEPVRISGVDWGTDRITVRFAGGHSVGVPAEYAAGLR